MSATFLLIRHAESTWNAAGRWQGHADPPLSGHGLGQAQVLARRLREEGLVDRLLCSDLERARRTAELVGRVLGLAPEADPRLRELDIGCWEGLTRAEITARDAAALARFDRGELDAPAGGAESRAAMRRRVRRAFREIADASSGRCIAVVTHLGVIHALLPGTKLENAESLRIAAREIASLAAAPDAG